MTGMRRQALQRAQREWVAGMHDDAIASHPHPHRHRHGPSHDPPPPLLRPVKILLHRCSPRNAPIITISVAPPRPALRIFIPSPLGDAHPPRRPLLDHLHPATSWFSFMTRLAVGRACQTISSCRLRLRPRSLLLLLFVSFTSASLFCFFVERGWKVGPGACI